jgi:tetratricopeptide (TPR) repeat protein
MSRSLDQRRAMAEGTRLVKVASSFLQAREYANAIGPLSDAARLMPGDACVANDLGLAHLFARHISEAIAWLQRSISLHPDNGRTHYNLGIALEHAGDDDAAILAHRRAVTLSPDLAASHARMADLLWELGRRREAGLAYRHASAAAAGTILGRICNARALQMDNLHQLAEGEIRRLIASEPASSAAHMVLGQILQEMGRFDEAVESFDLSIASAPSDAPWQATAYSNTAMSKKFSEADRPRLAKILSRLEIADGQDAFTPAQVERQRMTLHFAAGKGLDDLGDYADAMNHFHAANRIRHRLFPFDRRGVEQRFDGLMTRFTQEFFAKHSDIGDPDSTPILIVGMPRSGTTLLERILSSHPDVGGCGELDFWQERGPSCAHSEPDRLAEVASRLREDYLSLLRSRAPESLRATDKMPFNFIWVGLIHLLFPNARILHCRRNPVDTCLSIYTRQVGLKWGFSGSLNDLTSYYGLYARLMQHWRHVIPPHRLLDVDYESLVAQPEENARRLTTFCGLEWDDACLRPEANRDAVTTASLWQARQPIYRSSVERWRRYEAWIGDLLPLLKSNH